MSSYVYTIGHSNHPPEKSLELLVEAGIELLVDVRSNPASEWASHANPRDLKRLLDSAGIQYLYLGDTLGGRPSAQDCYDPLTGKPIYEAMRAQEPFQRGLQHVLDVLDEYRTCVMCAEEDPSSCHRNLLVGEALRQRGVRVLHIRGDGQVQTDEDLWKEKAGVAASQLALPFGDSS